MDTETLNFRRKLTEFLKGDFSSEESKRNFRRTQQQINEQSRSKQAWLVVLKLLLEEDDRQVKYFASNILKDKFKFDYGQLTPELFAMVVPNVIKVLNNNPKPQSGMLFNMSLVLVYLYMQEAEKLGDLLVFLETHLPGLVNYSLDVLLLLPEEIDNYKVVIEERKRNYLMEYVRSIQVQVLVKLNEVSKQLWEKKDGVRKEIILGCFSNWVAMKYNQQLLKELTGHYVLNAALSHMSDTSINKECEHAVLTTLRTMKGAKEDPELFQFLAKAVFPYFGAVRQHIKEQLLDMSEPYLNVLAKFGRVAAPIFVGTPSNDSAVFQTNMLELTLHVGIDNIESLVKYWKKFCITLHGLKNPSSVAYYQLMLEQLYQVLFRISEYSLEQCQDLNKLTIKQVEQNHQDFEEKQNYRSDIDEVFDVIGELITYQKCVSISLQYIGQLNVTDKNFPCKFEAALLPLVDIVDELQQPNEALTTTIKSLISFKSNYYCVQRAIIKVMSRCSKLYRDRKEEINMIFNFLVAMLQDGRLAEEAASAFEDVCDSNTEFVVANIASFMSVLNNYKENEKILHGIAVAVATDEKYMVQYLPALCQPYVQEITQMKSVEALRIALKRLTETIGKATRDGSVSCTPIIVEVFRAVWPHIKPVIDNPVKLGTNATGNDLTDSVHSLLERSCKFIKVCMRCLRRSFQPFLEPVFSSLLAAYDQFPIATYVYAVQVVVTVFQEFSDFANTLNQIYLRTCQITHKHLSQLAKFQSNPDLAEDFFGMNTRFMRYAPNIVLYSGQLDGLLELINLAVGVEHRQIANTLYMFMESLYQVFWSEEFIIHHNNNKAESKEFEIHLRPEFAAGYEMLRGKLLTVSQALLGKMVITHLNKAPSQSVRDSIRDAILAEILAFPQQNVMIWTPILAQLEQDILTIQEKKAFLDLLPTIRYQTVDDIKELIYLISKRYLHRKMRAPLN